VEEIEVKFEYLNLGSNGKLHVQNLLPGPDTKQLKKLRNKIIQMIKEKVLMWEF
jgi:hypothetical protein